MKFVHISAFDSWQEFDHNTWEATGSQTLSLCIMSPYFLVDMFGTTKRKKSVSFHLALFEIEATSYFLKNTVQSQAIFKYFQNLSNFASLYFEFKSLKLH